MVSIAKAPIRPGSQPDIAENGDIISITLISAVSAAALGAVDRKTVIISGAP